MWWWAWVRVWMCVLVWRSVAGQLNPTLSTPSTGTFFVSGAVYHNAFPPHSIDKHVLRKHRILRKGKKVDAYMILECGVLCQHHDNCSSFVITPEEGLCSTTNLDRCSVKYNYILASPGNFYYERFEGVSKAPDTCFNTCLSKNNSCDECGRPGCRGEACENCVYYCWDLHMNTSSAKIIRMFTPNQKHSRRTACRGRWDLWWVSSPNVGINTPSNLDLRLRLRLVYEDERFLTADFDSVKFHDKLLSVGKLINHTGAGNWWGAPFEGRPIRTLFNTNCRPFFYSNNTCASLTVPSVEVQLNKYNNTVKERGYPWIADSPDYRNVSIEKIELWVTHSTGNDEEEEWPTT